MFCFFSVISVSSVAMGFCPSIGVNRRTPQGGMEKKVLRRIHLRQIGVQALYKLLHSVTCGTARNAVE